VDSEATEDINIMVKERRDNLLPSSLRMLRTLGEYDEEKGGRWDQNMSLSPQARERLIERKGDTKKGNPLKKRGLPFDLFIRTHTCPFEPVHGPHFPR